jgi:hypothetical protein
MTGMNTYPQSYSHIKLPTKLEPVVPHFNLCVDYIHYYLHNTCYNLDQVKIEICNLLES